MIFFIRILATMYIEEFGGQLLCLFMKCELLKAMMIFFPAYNVTRILTIKAADFNYYAMNAV